MISVAWGSARELHYCSGMMPRSLTPIPLIAAALLSTSTTAQAQDEAHQEEERSSHVFGAKGMVVRKVVPAHDESVTEVGAAIFYERVLHEHLAVEGSFGVLESLGHGKVYAGDVVAKVPFELTAHIEPYLGIGATFLVEKLEAHTTYTGGGLSVAGTYLWLDEHFGFDAEVMYSVLDAEGEVGHELTGATGAVARF